MTDSNEPVTDVEEGVAKPATEKEEKSVTHQLLFWTMTTLSFVPFVVFFVIADKKIAVTVATGKSMCQSLRILLTSASFISLAHMCTCFYLYSTALAVFNFFLSLIYYKIGGTKCWVSLSMYAYLNITQNAKHSSLPHTSCLILIIHSPRSSTFP